MAADLVIITRVRVGGVLTSATSVVLRNPAGTAGVTRDDTSAIVVAAGTAMTQTSTGVYQHTIPAAVAGVVYRYYPEVLLNGTTYRDEDTASLDVALALPSYLTVEQADQLAAGIFGMKAWSTATTDNKLRALISASSRLDASRRWQGSKADASQELEFPRFDGREAIAPDSSTGVPTVPSKIKLATLMEADSILNGQRAKMVEAQHAGLSEQEIGTAREKYIAPSSNGIPSLCKDAHELADRYRLRSGRLL